MKEEQHMSILYFKCKLLTDVIISQSSATVGHQSTLDFIPGSNFLGIVAKELYKNDKLTKEEQLMMFHTGDVQFGDAHVMHKGIRTLRIPASMYYPKGGKVEEECYIHHGHKHVDNEQLKQCRKGFYAFGSKESKEKKIYKKEVGTSYAIKSAYDYESRRSKDAQMYGYESIDEGLEFLFEVRVSDKAANLADKIEKSLQGKKRIGRSKTAQYGMVEISKAEKDEFPVYTTAQSCKDSDGKEIQVVYADSRLIFLDKETGQPTFRPCAKDLGFEEGEIVWTNSQVRTFQYAPWNGHRKTYDADRCGIEKGSVFVVKGATSTPKADVVGWFKNEGFGKVIYNPEFLEYEGNGKASWTFGAKEQEEKPKSEENKPENTPLLNYIKKAKADSKNTGDILIAVNGFVNKYKSIFKSESFKSQWGNIRSIATANDEDKIYDALFKKETGYLTHGVGKDKWDDNKRSEKLEKFIKDNASLGIKKLLINLASEMQKAIK